MHVAVRGELCVTGALSTFMGVLGIKVRNAAVSVAASMFFAELSLLSFSDIFMA